jgi:hypothetical protein
VFGPATAGSTCCRGCSCDFHTVCGVFGTAIEIEKRGFENDRTLRKATVKSGRSVGVCEIELIWAIENLVK